MALPPQLTDEQRRDALVKAAEARRKRAAIKEDLRAGRTNLASLIDRAGDEFVGKLKVSSVLEALPGVGKIRSGKIMERLEISPSRRIRGLGNKQKEALLAEFGAR